MLCDFFVSIGNLSVNMLKIKIFGKQQRFDNEKEKRYSSGGNVTERIMSIYDETGTFKDPLRV